MPNIEMKTGVSGLDFAWAPGDVLAVGKDVDKAEAARWLAAGFAEETDKPRGLRSPAVEHVGVETAADLKSGVETTAGRRLFGAAAKAYLAKLAKGIGA